MYKSSLSCQVPLYLFPVLMNITIKSNSLRRDHDSNFEAGAYDELVKRGYEVHTQVGVSGYKIDLAI